MENILYIKNGIVVNTMTPTESEAFLASEHDETTYDTIQSDPSGLFEINEVFSIDLWEERNLTDVEKYAKAKEKISSAISEMLDNKAKEYGFDFIKSARSQAGFPLNGTETPEEVAIVERAISLARWELKCWGLSVRIENEVNTGIRLFPTVEEVTAEMPIYMV